MSADDLVREARGMTVRSRAAFRFGVPRFTLPSLLGSI
jgi:hypothetical protein